MVSISDKQARLFRLIGLNLVIAALYVAGKVIGKAPIAGGLSPVWPPTGIALSALVLFGREAIPGVALGCLSSLVTSGLPILPSLGIGIGNLAEAGLGAGILNLYGFRPGLTRRRDVLLLAIPTAVLGAGLGATAGCLSLGILPPHDWGATFSGWWSWCMEDLLGVLVVAPPILTLATPRRARDRHPVRRRVELASLLTVAGLLGYFVFGGTIGNAAVQFNLTYALFPLVLITADRHGPRGGSLATLVTAGSALLAQHVGAAPPGAMAGRDYLILLAGFLSLLALTSLLLAAGGEERRARSRELRGQARLMELATEAIGMASPSGRVLRLNNAGRELFGVEPARSLRELRVLDFLAPRERPRFMKEILPHVMKAGTWSGDLVARNLKDGTLIPTRHFLFRMDDPLDGRPEAFGSIGHDLREAQRAEAALRQTQRLESLGVLAGGIAHDYNNLLTAVLGHLDLAREMVEETHPAASHLAAVTTLAERSGALTRQLLAYAGKGAAEKAPVDLRHLVGDMAELLRSTLSRKADITLHMDSDLSMIHGDPVQVEQVVMNLLMNASEALEDRPGAIRLTLGEAFVGEDEIACRFPGFEMTPGPFVLLTVADTGVGMAQGTLDRIFDPFFTTKALGRGLGLSAMRGILQAHSGGIEVQSELGKGTAFTLAFPAMES